MKGVSTLVVVCFLASSTFGASVPTVVKAASSFISQVTKEAEVAAGPEECKMCIEFAGQAVNALLNMILQDEVDACGDLCGALADKTGSQALGFACSILCDIVGVKEFVKIIQKEDIDPIYMCELIPVCPVNDHGDANITAFTISPTKGPQGVFAIHFEYDSKNGTGTGELVLDVLCADGLEFGNSFLHQLAPAGTYDGDFQLKAQPDPECDPTQGPCEEWGPGQYTVKFAICNGECGSKHPHSQIYDQASVDFEITKDNKVIVY